MLPNLARAGLASSTTWRQRGLASKSGASKQSRKSRDQPDGLVGRINERLLLGPHPVDRMVNMGAEPLLVHAGEWLLRGSDALLSRDLVGSFADPLRSRSAVRSAVVVKELGTRQSHLKAINRM
jgi:hypothetical protein